VKTELNTAEMINGTVRGKVIHVDKFGDVVTNIKSDHLMEYSEITLNKTSIRRAKSFSECDGLCFIEGSSGYIEIIANRRKASEMLGLKTDDSLRITVK
ncbi:MAG: SAM hydroxide adenosyltransferase, partial [Nitrososphaeria archaeon]